MAAPHWYPFFVHDWLNDDVVQQMSWSERGFYHHMLTVSWLQNPPGTLPAETRNLCRVLGVETRTFLRYFCDHIAGRWIPEGDKLINLKLFEIGQKQLKVLNKRKEAGREGGLAKARNLLQQNPSKRPSNQSQRQKDPTPDVDLSALDRDSPQDVLSDLKPSDAFEIFWKAYPPRRNGKGSKSIARKSFGKAIKQESLQTLLDSIERHKQTPQWQETGGDLIPHPTTWLNQQRWTTEFPDDAELVGRKELAEAMAYFEAQKENQPRFPDERWYMSVQSRYGEDVANAVKAERRKANADQNGQPA